MRKGILVDLIHDKESEYAYGGRVCPELVPQETGDQDYFDDAMTE